MKTFFAIAVITIATAAAVQAGNTESRLFVSAKAKVKQLNVTLDKYEAFDKSYRTAGTQETKIGRAEMLQKVARRLRTQAQELVRKADQMEMYLKLEAALETDGPEIKRTKENIRTLKNEIELLKRKLEQKKTKETSGINVASR